MLVLPTHEALNQLSFYLNLTVVEESAVEWSCQVFQCCRFGVAAPLWVACVHRHAQAEMHALVQQAAERGFSVHIYNRQHSPQWNTAQVSFAPGATWTLQTWLGAHKVRQLPQDVLYGTAQVLRGSAPPSPPSPVFFDAEATQVENALNASLQWYAQEQDRRAAAPPQSPAPQSWMDSLTRYEPEPSRVGHAECVVCLSNFASVVLVNCGHQVMCDACARTLCEQKGRHLECPTCRTQVEHAPVHLFPSRIREH